MIIVRGLNINARVGEKKNTYYYYIIRTTIVCQNTHPPARPRVYARNIHKHNDIVCFGEAVCDTVYNLIKFATCPLTEHCRVVQNDSQFDTKSVSSIRNTYAWCG